MRLNVTQLDLHGKPGFLRAHSTEPTVSGVGDTAAAIRRAGVEAPQKKELALWPGVALSATVLGANMLGDALRDLLDPRLRGTQ